MIIRQAIFDTTGMIIVQTDYDVKVKLLEMEFIYVPADKTRLDEIFDEMVMLEESFIE
ncbi:hypothetical protein OPR95_002238 [Enterococcus hirae]|nr:hypothetical protein [Enterococcus hirae]EMF0159855.1 hypothetical protein [Enterococcus hirae]